MAENSITYILLLILGGLLCTIAVVVFFGIKTGKIKIEKKYKFYYDDSEAELKEI